MMSSSFSQPRARALGLFKALLGRLLAFRGLALRQLPRTVIDRPESELKIGFEHVVTHRMAHQSEFFFVQIGAFDGQAGDPIHRFVTTYGWRGILVEPQKRYFSRLIATYGDQPNLVFRNVAVGERREKKILYKIREGVPGLPAWAPQAASFDRSTVLSHREIIPDLEKLIDTEEVDCITLDDLLGEVPVPEIDLLQIDVEGYDHEIIRMLDFGRFAPSIIRFEHKHLSPRDYEASLQRLVRHGYRVAQEGPDTLAYRSRPAEADRRICGVAVQPDEAAALGMGRGVRPAGHSLS
jgi:FkbM family methyltransferase